MAKDFEQLIDFINRARAAGRNTDQIRALLTSAGWSNQQIDPFLAGGDLVPPLPPSTRESGRDVFFALLTFFTLGMSAVSLGSILFSLIGYYFPDQVVSYGYRSTGLAWALASFLVAAPVYAWSGWKYRRDVQANLTDARSRLRRVLTYLALFLASATVIGDVVALLYNFLNGEVNVRFLLKVAVILAIGGWIIWYYWLGLKRDEVDTPEAKAEALRWRQRHVLAFGVVAVTAVVAGFSLGGSPLQQQKVVRDQTRVQHLQQISYGVQAYYEREKKLPDALTSVSQGYAPVLPSDPQTGEPYGYAAKQGSSYELCATFETVDPAAQDARIAKPYYGPLDANWTHPAGKHCFDLQAQAVK